MSLKLMYITNEPEIAYIAENAGVDRIFVDMEYIGKEKRQGGMDTVQSYHTVDDIRAVKKAITKATLLVRINPIHEATDSYVSSKEEIDAAIKNGADMLMLPYFKTVQEVETFITLVRGRVKTMLLIETPEAVELIEQILDVQGIDEVFIGLNDLSLGYKMKFMFQLLSDGTVEKLCNKFMHRCIPYGFGGIASFGNGMLPSEYIIKEHYRLGSSCVILSRSFLNVNNMKDIQKIKSIFHKGIEDIRKLESECQEMIDMSRSDYFDDNKKQIVKKVNDICKEI